MSEVVIRAGKRRVAAQLRSARHPRATVVFVHGSGIDRHDARDELVAKKLCRARFSAILLDLLEPREALDYRNVFDAAMQAERLLEVLDRLERRRMLRLPLGYFANGVGAAVALAAAAKRPEVVGAVVARSGRPDKALEWLPKVQAPTLLIVDEPDPWNQLAIERLAVPKQLVVVPSPSHLFREPQAMAAVAENALSWFSRYLLAPRLSPEEREPAGRRRADPAAARA